MMDKCSKCAEEDTQDNPVMAYGDRLLCQECVFWIQDAQNEADYIEYEQLNLP